MALPGIGDAYTTLLDKSIFPFFIGIQPSASMV
jgi:hypothetical protein